MALDRLTGLMVFRTAAEEGSLAAAARRHGLSAEMAGRHLRALESYLGVRLMQRSTRKLSLTEAGRLYLARASAALDEIALADAEAGARQSAPQGLLRVAAPLAFATAALAPVADAYLRRYPKVRLSLDLSERPVDLLGEGFDLALRLGDLSESDLIARRLARFPLCLVAAPSYLAAHAPIVAPIDLAGHEALLYSQTVDPARLKLTGADSTVQRVTLSGRLEASDIGFLLEAALCGRGLLVAPSFVVAVALAEGRLSPVLPGWRLRDLPLYALLPHRRLLAASTRSFLDFLAGWFRSAAPEG